MTESTHSQGPEEVCIGQFPVSESAVKNSKIGGPEDIGSLLAEHWKTVATVLVLLFVVTTYQGRIGVLETQVESLNSIYESLPEEKALAVGALRSVEDMRQALTVMVEGQAVEWLAQPGVVRGGDQAIRRLKDLTDLAAGFGKLWGDDEGEVPAIYPVVHALGSILSSGEGTEAFESVKSSKSPVAYGIGQFVLGNRAAETGAAGRAEALSHLRAAEKALPSLSTVRGRRIALELSAGDAAWLKGQEEAFVSVYRSWWPKWQELATLDDSTITEFVVAQGIVESLVFPIFALSLESGDEVDRKQVTLSDLEEAVGQSFESALRLAVQMASKARDLNVDRLPGLVASAELDLALGAFLANQQQPVERRNEVWRIYQDLTKQFQGVALDLAQSALANQAFGVLQSAQQLASAHGESLRLQNRLLGKKLLLGLKVSHQAALGIHSESNSGVQH